jgi:hypothetical protein
MSFMAFPPGVMKVARILAAHEHANILPHDDMNFARKKSEPISRGFHYSRKPK